MPGSTDQQILAALLCTDLNVFVHKVFTTVSPGDLYRHNWHIEAITYDLGRCLSSDNTRLLITQPPRSLKSICSSVAIVAWALGHDPALRFICVSYSQELAGDLSRQFRLVVDSDWYRALFPRMRLTKDTGAQCVTSAGGGRIATSIGGTITGRGADIIIVDDPLKAEDAFSETARNAVIDWYSTTLVTRLNDKARGAIVVVMQRLHEDDLAGHLLIQGGWRHLDLPAIAIEDQRICIGPNPDDMHCRKEGEVLHPEREPRATLDRIKADLGSLTFSAQDTSSGRSRSKEIWSSATGSKPTMTHPRRHSRAASCRAGTWLGRPPSAATGRSARPGPFIRRPSTCSTSGVADPNIRRSSAR